MQPISCSVFDQESLRLWSTDKLISDMSVGLGKRITAHTGTAEHATQLLRQMSDPRLVDGQLKPITCRQFA